MPRPLPPRASLEHLRKQAKALLRDYRARAPEAVARFAAIPRCPAPDAATLAGAQHVLAREHGFPHWPALKAHVEGLARDDDPRAALLAAVREDDVARAGALLARHPALRAALNEPAPELPFGTLPLFPLAERGRREMIDLLLRHGADPNARSRWWAGGFGLLEVCDPALAPFLIERGATVDVHAAARLGMLDALEALVAREPGLVHARGGDGQTPLHYAATAAVADHLLDRGADPDALDVDHESTPAQWAVRDRPDVARRLVARGCRTDVLLAAALGDAALVRAILDADPDAVRTRASEEHFPMRDPRAAGHIYVWTLGRHTTAHRAARERGHHEVARLLDERTPDALRLAIACEADDAATVAALLAARPGLAGALGPGERRALPDAAEGGDAAAVRRMLAAGWPVDARGRHGATALHWAAWHGDAATVRELLRHAAPLDDRANEFGATPLGWALHGSAHGWRRETGDYGATVETLLGAGAALPAPAEGAAASEEAREALRRHAERASGPPR